MVFSSKDLLDFTVGTVKKINLFLIHAKERISLTKYGKVRLQLKKAYTDGTTHFEFTPEQFIKRLIALIPPPRQNFIRYFGVFGARHKNRRAITARQS